MAETDDYGSLKRPATDHGSAQMSELHDTLAFRFRFDQPFTAIARLLGITPESSIVELTSQRLDVRFGPWRVCTPRSNVESAIVSGPYFLPKVIGPPHLSMRDRGLTFATNAEAGVCISFTEPVPGIEPLGRILHPALTVTVEDPLSLVSWLTADPSLDSSDGRDAADERERDESAHDELVSSTSAELRRRARKLGIRGVNRRSKQELVELLDGRG
jgi:hypothetical protein